MFNSNEVAEIYRIANKLSGNQLSKGVLERLAQWATQPDWREVDALCVEIDAYSRQKKFGDGETQNQERAVDLKGLMRLLDGKSTKARARRAHALRLIIKLRREQP